MKTKRKTFLLMALLLTGGVASAQVKIEGNVYGGGKVGSVSQNTTVVVNDGEVGNLAYSHKKHPVDPNVYDTVVITGGAVFGGGKGDQNNPDAGTIAGNTNVEISGGQVYYNLYGGGELGSVTGKATVTVLGGQVGPAPKVVEGVYNIPIALSGLDGYVFGGGQGMSDASHESYANVGSSEVTVEIPDDAPITTNRIWGSIFGGGEDGHVFGDVLINFNSGHIGTWGTTSYDGNIFGGGRDYEHKDQFAGVVEGNITVNMTGGTMYGCIYGGGRLGSVGIDQSGDTIPDVPNQNKYYGYVTVNVSGGTVGRPDDGAFEYNRATIGHIYGGCMGIYKDASGNVVQDWDSYGRTKQTSVNISGDALVYGNVHGGAQEGLVLKNSIVNITGGTIGDVYVENGVEYHKTGGNVFGGGKGNSEGPDAGRVFGNTLVTVEGGKIYYDLYGGGNLAGVGNGPSDMTLGKSQVIITGGQIGLDSGVPTNPSHPDIRKDCYVFGGGKGINTDARFGYVNSTYVEVDCDDTDNVIKGCVFGGGEDGYVYGNTEILYKGGILGTAGVQQGYDGNIFGGGKNMNAESNLLIGGVGGNVVVTMEGGQIMGNIYGGGNAGSVGVQRVVNNGTPSGTMYTDTDHGLTTVTVSGGQVGVDDLDSPNSGMVYGACRGRDSKLSIGLVLDTEVEITGTAQVMGNVYGGGQVGQVIRDTEVTVSDGTVGSIEYQTEGSSTTYTKIAHITGGSVFGGGKGVQTVRDAALVKGNSTVTIGGGHVYYNVYGGGELASVGLREAITDDDDNIIDYKPVANTGLATVTINGGQVGPAPKTGGNYNITCGLNGTDGDVFGGGKGVSEDYIDPTDLEHPYSGQYYDFADVNNTIVTIEIPADVPIATNRIWGSSFGGAEDGHVLGDAHTYYKSGLMGTEGKTSYDGNIFGGGRNYSKANYNAGRVRGNNYVEMSGGQIYGSIFGGGRLALTGVDLYGDVMQDVGDTKYGNTYVTVKGGKVGNDTKVTVNGTEMDVIDLFTEHSMGDVFGGGKGDKDGIVGHPKASALLVSIVKNTTVEISEEDASNPTIIYGSVFGGGEVASVGQFDWDLAVTDPLYDPENPNNPDHPTPTTIGNIRMIEGTGKTKVTVSGGTIGATKAQMRYELVDNGTGIHQFDMKYHCDRGHVLGGGEGRTDDPGSYATINPGTMGHNNKSLLDLLATVGETDVTITNNVVGEGDAQVTFRPLVKGSVYGGGMNGHVLRDTKVTVEGGQIGVGYNKTTGVEQTIYDEDKFFNPLEYFEENPTYTDVHSDNALFECFSWDYDPATNRPYDPIDLKAHPTHTPSNGKTWFGNVFGGGSGYHPYIKEVTSGSNVTYEAHWDSIAGKVYGKSEVFITGGHVLTSIYGGCETTDVVGSATVKMSGGTLGVPRTLNQIGLHPVTCYLFGAGKGDPRTYFNTWTNVGSVVVEVSGGKIYGSVFGGGEEGHVLGDVTLTVKETNATDEPTIIGTTGTSYVDGNIFGGGRGFSGEALTAGTVGGNVDVYIQDGVMLGSIYGGGRLASVGTHFTNPDDPEYGQFQAGEDHGHVTIDITGGTIGNDFEAGVAHTKGGNVYGGSMGRTTLLNGDNNIIWPSLAKVKHTSITVDQGENKTTLIKGNVYGGGELGTIGLCGDEDNTGASVSIEGGTIKRNVFGGGYGSNITTAQQNDSLVVVSGVTKYASPMQIAGRVYGNTSVSMSAGTVEGSIYGGGEMASVGYITDSIKHPDPEDWEHLTNNDKFFLSWPYGFTYATGTGTANVSITGGTVGTPDSGNGDVFGGGMGIAGPRHRMAQCANVDNTIVTIEEDEGKTISIKGNVYGGGENGHVNTNAQVTMNSGTIDQDIYGAGKGTDTYPDILYNPATHAPYTQTTNVRSITAGKVYGNTTVTMNNGLVKGNIYGGGEFASVGKSNYMGYGETGDETTAQGSGHTHVYIYGGTVGTDGDGNGMVFGSSQGTTFATINLSPRYFYSRDFFLGYSNNTTVVIGNGTSTPTINGSVFGGGEDGHVRLSTNVNVKSGTVGAALASGADPNSDAWKLRGNVYGAGRGIDMYDSNGDGQPDTYCPSAGSVTRSTTVTIEGGTIYNNVYGGGSMAAVGPPPGFTNDPSLCKVDIKGGTIGASNALTIRYGGYVYGASRGIACDDATWNAWNNTTPAPTNPSPYMNLASCVETQVNISKTNTTTPTIQNVVFGGGSNGRVSTNTEVNMTGGTVKQGIYGGGQGVWGETGYTKDSISGRVQGNALVKLMGGEVGHLDGTTPVGQIFGGARRSNVWGNATVNVGTGTWNETTQTYENLDGDVTIYGSVFGANNHNGTPRGNVTVNVFKTHHEPMTGTELGNWYPASPHGTTPTTPAQLGNLPNEISNYAIYQVFGGSNETDYLPRSGKEATVNVCGCEENTVYNVYGGSNAANIGKPTGYTTDVNVHIYGGRINNVFGGGKGSATTAANIYGTANTTIDGGLINAVFGGSDGNGNINEINLAISESPGCNLIIGNGYGGGNSAPEIGDIVTTLECCTNPASYNNFYGGARSAVIYGNVTLNAYGGIVNNLFGGSEGTTGAQGIAADIKKYPLGSLIAANSTPTTNNGTYPQALVDLYWSNTTNYVNNYQGTGGNVTVNLYGGTFTNVFGGSDANGNIEGEIVVNVLDIEGNCPLKIANIYGASNETPYDPDDIIVENVPQNPVSPVINVVHIKDTDGISQNVYGAGKGVTATATSNPVVNIGYDATPMQQYIPNTYTVPATPRAYVRLKVYGGGKEADLYGNPTINIRRSNTEVGRFVYGGGSGDENDIHPEYAKVHGSDTVRIFDGWVKRGVYGGGEKAIVTGDTRVEISGGTVGSSGYLLYGTVFGGGQGIYGYTSGNQHVVPDKDFGRVMGNTYVGISGNAQILKDVYGGGQMGSVGGGTGNCGLAKVVISGGQIGPYDKDEANANVFGGGQGYTVETGNSPGFYSSYTEFANVDSTSVIICNNARIYGNVYGGSANGHVLGDTRVLIEKGTNSNNSTPTIGTDAMYGDGHVFGGGQGTGWYEEIEGDEEEPETVFHLINHCGRVGGNTKVKMTDGTVLGTIYGGGKLALTGVDVNGEPSFMTEIQVGDETVPVYDSIHHGLASIEVSGGTIGFGETDELGYALLDCEYSVGDIFGGGRGDWDNYQDILAGRVANTDITISNSPRIYCSVFGGGEIAGVGYWDDDNDKHPFVPQTGTTKVTVGGNPTIGLDYEFDPEYGEDPVEWTMFETINNVSRIYHTCSGNIFGACQGDASVTYYPSWVSLGRSRTAYVEIKDNPTIKSSVFGGAEQGTVTEDTHVTISGGTIGQEGLTSYTLNSTGNLIPYGTYSFGNVYGGGFGVDSLQVQTNDSIEITGNNSLIANVIAGRVYGNTYVDITGGIIRGNVFGGGNMASVGRWTDVLDDKDNLIDYAPVANTGEATVNVGGTAIVGPMDGTGLNAYVFGGGRGIGKDPNNLRDKYCNVNSTNVTVELTYEDADPNAPDPEELWDAETDGRIYGSVYGGGSDCHVLGNTKVIFNGGIIGTYKDATQGITAYGGNIFGSGRNFQKLNYAAGRVAGNTNIEMNDGVVYGAIFGGGRHAVTGTGLDGMHMRNDDATGEHGKTTVKVKGGTVGYKPLVTTFTQRPIGDVYGAGKGTMAGITGHPDPSPLLIALVKNTEVEISQPTSTLTRVLGSVYGGGEVGNVGHYAWRQPDASTIDSIILVSDGHTDVTVKGGRIGVDRMEMSYQLVGGNGNDKYNPATNAVGNVFGGGRGLSDDPTNYAANIDAVINEVHYDKYLLDLMASAGSTTVTIENTSSTNRPWVKGSVYGGSASGHVLGDTEVNIDGGQIGSGNNANADEWYEDNDFLTTGTVHECYHWEYDADDPKPFDLVEIYNGIVNGVYTYVPTDGKTWYGNVFGGGSGFLPYVKNGVCVWNPDCGKVYGDATVTITGGHILSSVYGGSEISDVGHFGIADANYNQSNPAVHVGELYCISGGTATVTMSGGTVGVPRTTQQIKDYPVPGYLFGAGKGDSRDNFNALTNVNTTSVTVSDGAKVFGSVLGGGEQGRVVGDASVVVEKSATSTVTPVIGCTGFSGYDGHVFGGGWGDKSKFVSTPESTYNCPAGRVGGNTFVTMTNGTVLGNVYGGGYVARVGVGVKGEYDSFISGTEANREYDSINHGVATVEVKGGFVGNFANNGLYLLLSDQKVGNVYGGGRGSADEYHEDDLGRVAKAVVKIMSNSTVNPAVNPTIYGSVFGGGQMANVGHWNNYASWYTTGTGRTEVNITGAPSIGTPKEFDLHYASGDEVKTQYDVINNVKMISHTRTGNVFGGGQGDMKKITGTGGAVEAVGFEQGHCRTTTVTIDMDNGDEGGHILGSVFGGSEQGAVWGNANVNISGGTIGQEGLVSAILDANGNPTNNTGSYSYGSVFGGSYGLDCYSQLGINDEAVADTVNFSAGRVYRNTHVSITGGAVRGNVFGGGHMASVGQWTRVKQNGNIVDLIPAVDGITNQPTGKATVSVTGSAIIGPLDMTGLNAYVFGGGKGIGNDLGNLHKRYGNVNSTKVTVNLGEAGRVYGSLFGGGSDGHVLGDAEVNFNGGILGTAGTTTWDGNIFGGGRNFRATNITAGRVGGNITVEMTNGTMYGNIYGGGRLASTGVDLSGVMYTANTTTHGNITVEVTGGTIGNEHKAEGPSSTGATIQPFVGQIGGNIFGGAMGEDIKPDMEDPGIDPNNYTNDQFAAYTDYIKSQIGWVRSTKVTVSGAALIPVLVRGNVFGGAKSGRVKEDTEVTIEGNTTIGESRVGTIPVGELFYSGSVYGAGLGSEKSVAHVNYVNSLVPPEPVDPTLLWPDVGLVRGNTEVYINNTDAGTPKIYNNIYGGGALGNVGTVTNGSYAENTGTTYVEVSGGELGPLDDTGLNAYVFGGGKGQPYYALKDFGKVYKTHVVMNGDARVYGSLFGGGEDGHVVGNALIDMDVDPTTGILGTSGETGWDGNIFGGGRNFDASHEATGRVGGNDTINVKRGRMLGSIFGGGRLGSVGVDENGDMQEGDEHGFILVNVGGDIQTGEIVIGHTAYNDHDRVGGNVYGGGKGIAGAPTTIYPQLAKVKQTTVNIGQKSGEETWIEGSVFGSGEDGHVLQDTYVNIYGGQIGGHDYGDLEPCEDPYHGNVYGGGRGVDTYEQGGQQHYSVTAGWVQGNTNVNITGGHIVRNVYGGGNLASVGDPEEEPTGGNYLTGLASVTITGGTVGTVHENENFGNVFGSSHGDVGGEYVDLAFVKNTHVTIGQTAKIYGSVFGGGEDGHVRKNTLVDIEGGVIGDEDDVNMPLDGNVYGGGRGLTTNGNSPTAGEVYGHTTVNIKTSTVNGTTYTPTVWNNVYGGGSQSVVQEYKVVNMSGGLVKGSVFGGSRQIPAGRTNKAPRWVNMWGGTIEGNLHGCSYYADDDNPSDPYDLKGWASFVNLSGGTIGKVTNEVVSGGNVYGAGYGGKVNGSVAVLIGKNAIVETSDDEGDEFFGINIHKQETPSIANLDIKGSVFGGSYGSIGSSEWDHSYNVTGYSRVYIDGTGYNTTASAPVPNANDFMNIGGGVYGCGTNCESGKQGRNILIRNYGTRNPEGNPEAELTQVSRILTTIQRGDIILLDNTNVNLSGASSINQEYEDRNYGICGVDEKLYVTNGSAIDLGMTIRPAYMDSIREVHSLYLKDGVGFSYNQMGEGSDDNWEVVGIKDNTSTPSLYRLHSNGTQTVLSTAQENVIVFNGDSRLWVRHKDAGAVKYGELRGFFRMRANAFTPIGNESFAYARPKLTANVNHIEPYTAGNTWNKGDGGFLSYKDGDDNGYNYFTKNGQKVLEGTTAEFTYNTEGDDGGTEFTKTKQYPYFNIGEFIQREDNYTDMVEYRQWALPTVEGNVWYVDGTRNWGRDLSHEFGWGDYPDKPKLTITGAASSTNSEIKGGICIDTDVYTGGYTFNAAKDIIFVVGAVNAELECAAHTLNLNTDHPLRLFRYPGGHTMSNGQTDAGTGGNPASPNTNTGVDEGSTAGPGVNTGMMIHSNTDLIMDNVSVDGLYEYTADEKVRYQIPDNYASSKLTVTEPLVVTEAGTTLSLKGGTTLKRGYNNTDAATTWYYDADYVPTGNVHHGGALFVAPDVPASGETPARITTVNVEGLVTITGSKQRKGGTIEAPVTIESNVYLPTFDKSLNISGTENLNVDTRIGITSPKRNKEDNYKDNTFSPIAVAPTVAIARNAWERNNFTDDQNWFFVRDDWGTDPNLRRTTYYFDGEVAGQVTNPTTLYFGWTWANVARKQPSTYVVDNDNNTITVSSEEALAWLISKSAGMNGEQIPTGFADMTINQTADFDMKQYVWVPVGTESHPFAGTYDGRGHIIEGLSIEYLGIGDKKYKRNNYGMFGNVNGGKIKRTFLVGGLIAPESILSITTNPNANTIYSIGGLAGYLEGTNAVVSNSEAAVEIVCPNYSFAHNVVAGGLVGQMANGLVHSSMAMPVMSVGALSTGEVGGLVGKSSAGNIYNSFVNAQFGADAGDSNHPKTIGGLLCTNAGTEVRNCYVAMHDNQIPTGVGFDGLLYASSGGSIESCYLEEDYASTHLGDNNKYFRSASSSDKYGYMYLDNTLKVGGGAKVDTVMFRVMNKWVKDNNGTGHTYARWARPGLQEINGDLPVLLLDEFSDESAYQGYFRSLGTYAGGCALQYGGPKRDGDGNTPDYSYLGGNPENDRIGSPDLDGALVREGADDCLFIYGDITTASTQPVQAKKVSIHEDVSILDAGSLANFPDTYVGVTFDNSCGKATSTPGVNYGLNGLGMGGYPLPRDWHMFSTPLQEAPLGFEYYLNADYSSVENNTNRNTYSSGYVGTYYNNIWTNPSTEFSWLNNGGSGDKRYWMKGWKNSQSQKPVEEGQVQETLDSEKWVDGYFPSQYRDRFGEGCIENTDEWGRYPYGMDFYTWTEPDYHWINFKRNGPNHWHSDGDHDHLDYKPYGIVDVEHGKPKNVNEDNLIVGRGYMASIGTETLLQSHGTLNVGTKEILLTNSGSTSKLPGWNLVGNPYHGYLDFDLVGTDSNNSGILSTMSLGSNNVPFYVIYDADMFEGEAESAFRYYPVTGSVNGDYAGRYLHPHQGFYVRKKDGGNANMRFTEDMIVSRSVLTAKQDGHFRDLQPKYPLVNLYLSSDNGCADVTVIEFNRPEWNGAIKLKELRVGNGLFYGQHDGTYYAALFAEEGTERVPLWFEAKEDDIFTIKWNTANGDFHSMYLIDNIAGVQYDMLRNDTYSFEGHKRDYPSRFYIVFDVTGVDEFDEGDHNFVFFDGSQWVVTGDGILDFIDVHGRVLWSSSVSGQSRVGLPKVACGVYLMRLTNSEGTRVQKVIINKI